MSFLDAQMKSEFLGLIRSGRGAVVMDFSRKSLTEHFAKGADGVALFEEIGMLFLEGNDHAGSKEFRERFIQYVDKDALEQHLEKMGGSTETRMSMEDMKEAMQEMLKVVSFDAMPPSHQLLAKTIMRCKDEREFSMELRRVFYTFPAEDKFMLVSSAFEDESAELGPIRQLISELPEHEQARILGTRQLPKP